MSIEEIRALKEKFFESDDHKVKDKLARDAIYKAGMMLRRELSWATNYDVALMLREAGLFTWPDKITAGYLEEVQTKITTAPNQVKLMVLARLLSGLSFSDATIELASALSQLIDAKNPSLLKSPKGKHLGTIELWTYKGMAVAHIAYLTALGHTSESAIEIVADAFTEEVAAVENWNRRAKRPRGIDSDRIDFLVHEAREEGRKYKKLRIRDREADSPDYGLARIKEIGARYRAVSKQVITQQREKQKKGK